MFEVPFGTLRTTGEDVTEIDFVNSIGQVVITKALGADVGDYNIDIKNMIPGLYCWQIKNSQHIIRFGKLVILR